MNSRFFVPAVAMLLISALAGCTNTREEKKVLITSGTVNIGPASLYPAGTANTKFVATYGIVIVNSSGDPLAILPKCSPTGAMAKWIDSHHEFYCADDESRFDMVGHVVEGPAKRPLPAIRAEKQPDGTLTVNLTKLNAM